MRTPTRFLRRHAATLATAAGAAVFAASLAGFATVDRDLRAVASWEGATTVRVVDDVVVADRAAVCREV